MNTARRWNIDNSTRIDNIFSGSCTPAQALLELVYLGEVSMMEAEQRWRARCSCTLTEGAEIEIANIRRLDC